MRIEHIGAATLYLGDCREILPTLGKVDAVVTDPPYGIGITRRGSIGTKRLADVKDYGKKEWDDDPPPSWLIDQIRDKSEWQIIFGGNFFDLPPSSCWLVWDKRNTGDFADCELAWTNLPKAVRKIEWMWNGCLRKGSDVREHPTQKPLGVMAWCLDHLPDDVRLICDPFMGSGTTAIAAARKGLSFVGIEREKQYFEAACVRLSEALRSPQLFTEPAAIPAQESWAEMWSKPIEHEKPQ